MRSTRLSEEQWGALRALCRFKATMIDACEILRTDSETIEKALSETYGQTFDEYRNSQMSYTRYNLFKKQYEVAVGDDDRGIKPNVNMLIWLGKQYLGQSEKTETKDWRLGEGDVTWVAEFAPPIIKDTNTNLPVPRADEREETTVIDTEIVKKCEN